MFLCQPRKRVATKLPSRRGTEDTEEAQRGRNLCATSVLANQGKRYGIVFLTFAGTGQSGHRSMLATCGSRSPYRVGFLRELPCDLGHLVVLENTFHKVPGRSKGTSQNNPLIPNLSPYPLLPRS